MEAKFLEYDLYKLNDGPNPSTLTIYKEGILQ